MHGFDEYFGNLYHLNASEEPENLDYPKNPEFRKKFGPRGVLQAKADGKGGQTIEDTGPLTKKRMETIDEETVAAALGFHRPQQRAGKPCFCGGTRPGCISAPTSRPNNRGISGQDEYSDGMVEHDRMVGELLKHVDDLGIANDTIVFYSTDNGPHYNTWPDAGTTPFRSEKNSNWEGAYRVPAFVRWPGHFQAGVTLNGIVAHEDWMPTFLAAAGMPDVKDRLMKGDDLRRPALSLPPRRLRHERLPQPARRSNRRATSSGTSTTTARSSRRVTTTGRSCSWRTAARHLECGASRSPNCACRCCSICAATRSRRRSTTPRSTTTGCSIGRLSLCRSRGWRRSSCMTMKDYPPSQTPGSFNLTKIEEQLQIGERPLSDHLPPVRGVLHCDVAVEGNALDCGEERSIAGTFLRAWKSGERNVLDEDRLFHRRWPCCRHAGRESPHAQTLSPAEAKAIAADAYLYAYPMLYNYKTLFQQTADPSFPGYIGGFNRYRHYSRGFTPADKDIVTPSNDTPYSWAWLDLRAEPMVVSVPASPDRYYVLQWFDLYTHNFAYIGSRATGTEAGDYLFVGPGWNGETPKGIKKVFRSETQFIGTLTRTSWTGAEDRDGLVAMQRQYRIRPLSEYTGSKPPEPAPAYQFPAWDEARANSIGFIDYLNFILQFTPPVASEKATLGAVCQDRNRPWPRVRCGHARSGNAGSDRGWHQGRKRQAPGGNRQDHKLGRSVRDARVSRHRLRDAARGRRGVGHSTAIRRKRRTTRRIPPIQKSRHWTAARITFCIFRRIRCRRSSSSGR